MTYKALNNKGPQYIRDLLTFKEKKGNRESRAVTNKELNIPSTKRAMYGDRAFMVAAPTLWNNIPLDTREMPSLASFKNALKTYLFRAGFHELM